MRIKLSPYNSPFIPCSEPGVYWLGREFQGDRLHDAHVSAFYSKPNSPEIDPSVAAVLVSCGMPHLAKGKGSQSLPSARGGISLHTLATDGVKAAQRILDRNKRAFQ